MELFIERMNNPEFAIGVGFLLLQLAIPVVGVCWLIANSEWLKKLKCWWNHDWQFVSGDWMKGFENKVSIIIRKCSRCPAHQEIEHMKEFGISFLKKEWE